MVSLDDGVDPTLIERKRTEGETIRDFLADVSVIYGVDIVRFELNYDGTSSDEKDAPFDRAFLDETVADVLNYDPDEAEETTIILNVEKHKGEKKEQIMALKQEVAAAEAAVARALAAVKAAKAAVKAASLPAQKGGARKRYTRRR